MKLLRVLMLVVFAVVLTAGTAYAIVTLVAPNGGESWTLGSNQDIIWTYAAQQSGTVVLKLMKGTIEVGIIKSNILVGDKKYSWEVGEYIGGTADAGTDYKIKIVTQFPSHEVMSNSTFTIEAPGGTTTSPVTTPMSQ
jgi:hypothetical protein